MIITPIISLISLCICSLSTASPPFDTYHICIYTWYMKCRV
jgi:hypothetical protein